MATRPAIFKWRQTEPVLILSAVRWCYLYWAIDSAGATIDFLLSAFRDSEAAKRLFRKALSHASHPQPRVINTDLAPIYGSAIPDIKKEGTLRRRCRHRPVQYLNNILEQDHRAIKRRVNAKQGFREFQAAQRTIQGYEAMNMMRRGRFGGRAELMFGVKFSSSTSSSNWPPELAASTVSPLNSCAPIERQSKVATQPEGLYWAQCPAAYAGGATGGRIDARPGSGYPRRRLHYGLSAQRNAAPNVA